MDQPPLAPLFRTISEQYFFPTVQPGKVRLGTLKVRVRVQGSMYESRKGQTTLYLRM